MGIIAIWWGFYQMHHTKKTGYPVIELFFNDISSISFEFEDFKIKEQFIFQGHVSTLN